MKIRIKTTLYLLIAKAAAVYRKNPNFPVKPNPRSVHCILVVSNTAFGDSLLNTPAIRNIKKHFSNATIVGLIRDKFIGLFESGSDLDMILPSRCGWKRFWRTVITLRRLNIDIAYILHGDKPYTVLLSFFARSKIIFSMEKNIQAHDQFAFIKQYYPISAATDLHIIDYRIQATLPSGCSDTEKRIVVGFSDNADKNVNRFLNDLAIPKSAILVGIQVRTSLKSKEWPINNYVSLIKQLLQKNSHLYFLVMGDKKNQAYCQKITKHFNRQVINIAGSLNLSNEVALFARYALVVTPDTGPMHLSIALGTPTICLFGTIDPAIYGPYYNHGKHTIIRSPISCSPCNYWKCEDCRMMRDISVTQVEAAVLKTLSCEYTASN